jgi:hypothetical protein
MITCQKCKTQNLPGSSTCQQCGVDLLPPESKGNRITKAVFLALLAVAVSWIGLAFKEPFLTNCSSGIAILVFLYGLLVLFRKTLLYQRYIERANRHVKVDAEQALRDYASAIQSAPDAHIHKPILAKAKWMNIQDDSLLPDIITASRLMQNGRDKLVSKMNKKIQKIALAATEAQKEQVKSGVGSPQSRLDFTYLLEACIQTIVPEKDYGTDPLSAITTGASIGWKRGSINADVNIIRNTLVENGEVKLLGFCPRCKDFVVLDEKKRCQVDGGKVRGSPTYALVQEIDEVQNILRKRQAL